MPKRRSLLLFAALGVAVLVALSGCKSRPAPAPTPAVALPLPQAPAGLIAELSVPNLSISYQTARAYGGPGTEALPASPELTLAAALELPPAAAGALLLDRPLAGVVTAADGGKLALVLASRVRSGAELVLALTKPGVGARTATVDPKSGLTELAGPGRPLGIVGDWLVVSSDAAALRAAGPYAARVLGAKAGGAESLVIDVPEAALGGALASFLSERWTASRSVLAALAAEQQAAARRPPDFGDPNAILRIADAGIGTLVEYLKSSKSARIALTLAASGVELTASLEPRPGGLLDGVAQKMVVGPFADGLRFPADVGVTLLSRSAPSDPDAFPASAVLGALGQRPGAKETTAVTEATRSLAGGLDGTWSFGLRPGGGKLLRLGVRDAAAVERGMLGLVKALRLPALREPLAKLLGKVAPREELTTVNGVGGKVHHLVIAPPNPSASGFELWWLLQGQELLVLAGSKTADLAALADAGAGTRLAQRPDLSAMVGRRMPASLASFVDLAPAGSNAAAPIVFASGRRDGRVRTELEVSPAAVALLLAMSGRP